MNKKTYKIELFGYGGEIVLGSVTQSQYEFWHDRTDFEEHCTDWNNKMKFSEEVCVIHDGNWHEVDDLKHAYGAEFCGSSQIMVTDCETDDTVFESKLDNDELEQRGVDPNGFAVDEYYVYCDSDAEYAFLGQSVEKGLFFTGEITVDSEFDPAKLSFSYTDIEGWSLVNGVSYESQIVEDTTGGDTVGKGLEFKIFKVDR